MALSRKKTLIEAAEIVPPISDQAFSFVPSDGAEVFIDRFEGAFSGGYRGAITCVWDFGGVDEKIVDVSNSNIKKLIGVGDGVKKVALMFTNNDDVDDLYFSGSLIITEQTAV